MSQQNDLDCLHTWAKTWKLSFYPRSLMLYDLVTPSPRILLEYTLSDSLNNFFTLIQSDLYVKDLGVLFDQKLTISCHVNRIVAYANKRFGYYDQCS